MKLSTQKATTAMTSAIHTLKQRAGMDEATYRDFLEQQAGVRSARDLSVAQAGTVIERLKVVAGEGAAKGAVAGLDNAIGGKLRALWISGYNLGIIKVRTDQAMLKFLERQTGVSHVRFLQQPRDGAAAIEGLKSWLARHADVAWPADSEDIIGAKRAVLDAQWRRLIVLGDVVDASPVVDAMSGLQFYAGRIVGANRWEGMQSHHYDQVQAALGRKLRGVLMRRDQKEQG